MRVRGFVDRGAVLLGAVLLLAACGSVPPAAGTGSPSPIPSASPLPSSSPAPSPTPVSASGTTRTLRISLEKQHLWVYEGTKLIASTDVTTGMAALPTPAGHFHILAKYSPYRFISPWPRGSPYYYEPLDVSYAMLFAAGGYFIHDAWWQRNFGPGGNLITGSHGCVNVPPSVMGGIYRWARVGDDVIIA